MRLPEKFGFGHPLARQLRKKSMDQVSVQSTKYLGVPKVVL